MPWFEWLGFEWLVLAGVLIVLALTWFPIGALIQRANRSFDPLFVFTGKSIEYPETYFWTGYISLVVYLVLGLAAAVYKAGLVVYKAGLAVYKAARAYWYFVRRLRGEDKK